MLKDLIWIKKHYGEQMMHLCRELFPVILEKEGVLPQILDKCFAKSRLLARDIIAEEAESDFKNFIYSFVDVENTDTENNEQKTAVELLDEAGYILYPECETEEDIQFFKKYWTDNEALCTFKGDRLKHCRVWFAIKKNIDDIKRENFSNPKRQDEYGTSAISIQFTRQNNQSLSIKNRYNHSVNNPDNTFSSNLDNIISGLTGAFYRDYGVWDMMGGNKYEGFELDHYIFAPDGKYYHYNYEIDNVYFCDNNTLIDHYEIETLPNHQMLADYFVVDFKNKTINNYDNCRSNDGFPKTIQDIEKMEYKNNNLKVCVKDGSVVEIGLDERNRIVSYKNENIKEIKQDFMWNNEVLKSIDIPNVTRIGDGVLGRNKELEDFNAPKVEEIGEYVLYWNENLKKLDLPELTKCGRRFLLKNEIMENMNIPKLEKCGDFCFQHNRNIEEINLPNLKSCGDCFFENNKIINSVFLPKLEDCGILFLAGNENLKEIDLPNLKRSSNNFMLRNENLCKINVPNLEETGYNFLCWNQSIKEIDLPSIQKYYSGLLNNDINLEKISVSGRLNDVDYHLMCQFLKKGIVVRKDFQEEKIDY